MPTLAEMSHGSAISLTAFIVLVFLCVVLGVFLMVDPNRRGRK